MTLFLPLRGEDSFGTLDGRDAVDDFFRRHFPDVVPLMPGVAREFSRTRSGGWGRFATTGPQGTRQCSSAMLPTRWCRFMAKA